MQMHKLIGSAVAFACLATAVAAQDAGGKADADQTARDLANPNSPLASLTFKNRYTWYKGDVPGADSEKNYEMLFQPVFPFQLGKSASGADRLLFVRPAIPFISNQPFTGTDGIGDIGFDIAYGETLANGFIWTLGLVGTLPTATDSDLGGNFALGPEFIVAKQTDWGLYGIFPTHQWSFDSSDNDVDLSTIQPVLQIIPGGGWAYGSKGTLQYDWNENQWTIPIQGFVSKTFTGGRIPIKVELEANYYVTQPDDFGPEWMIGINITPVVPNFIANWFKG